MNEFVQSSGGKFVLNGKPFRFIGANVYELANLETPITEKIMEDSAGSGFKVLRFWLFQNKDTQQQITKLNEICDLAKDYDIKLIIALADKWGYLQNYRINYQWYTKGYKNGYLDYVKTVTGECSARNEIMIWELINEPETDSFEAFYSFVQHTAEEIKSVNQNHILSLGTVGGIGDKFGNYFSVLKRENFCNLYSLSSLEAVSVHDYSFDSGIFERLDILYRLKGNNSRAKIFEKINDMLGYPFYLLDRYYLQKKKLVRLPLTLRSLWNSRIEDNISFAAEIKKPVYIGEAGFKNSSGLDRKRLLQLYLDEKFNTGISGCLLWSFESHGWNKDGHSYGFSKNDSFDQIIKKWNKKLNQ